MLQKQAELGVLNERKQGTKLIVDSGGFQIATGKLAFDWDNFSTSAKNDAIRDKILAVQNEYADYAPIIDVPSLAMLRMPHILPSVRKCLDYTIYNIEYYKKQTVTTKLLNVLQGTNSAQANEWFDGVHDDGYFAGYALGGHTAQNLPLMLEMILRCLEDKNAPELIHILGQSRIGWVPVLSSIKTAIKKVSPETEFCYDTISAVASAVRGQAVYGWKKSNKKITKAVAKLPMVDIEQYGDLVNPFDTVALNGLTYAEWMLKSNSGANSNQFYSLLASHNLEMTDRSHNELIKLFAVDLLTSDPTGYKNWTSTDRGFLPFQYTHLHHLINDIIVNKDYDLIDKYRNRLNAASIADEKNCTTIFDQLFGEEEGDLFDEVA